MSMRSKPGKNTLLLTISLLLICALAAMIEWQFHILQSAYDEFVMDNRNHYLSCEDLPSRTEAERIVEGHKDVIQRIEQVAPESVGVEIDSLTCEGKADLIIWYGTHEQRIVIEEILGNDTFFGIPYRLRNR